MSAMFVKAGAGCTVPFPDGRRLPGDPTAAADGSIEVDGGALFVQRCIAHGDLIVVTPASPPADPGYDDTPSEEN